MTSKLKCPVCPYCDKPLNCIGTQYINKHIVAMWCCQNPECEYSEDLIGTREMWEAFTNSRHIFAQGQENTKELAIKLIQAKQDLEIARKALKKIESTEWYDSMSSYEIMTFTAMKALTQIEHKVDDNE